MGTATSSEASYPDSRALPTLPAVLLRLQPWSHHGGAHSTMGRQSPPRYVPGTQAGLSKSVVAPGNP